MSRLRFAVLGTAKIARRVVPHIQAAQETELLAVASRDQQKADAFAAEFDLPRSYGSYERALADPDIDAVYVPLPPSMHADWTVRAAEAGKHVLCEKPLSVDAADVDRMISACRQHQVVLLDGVMWYHTPRAAEMQQIIETGQLGRLRQCTSVFTFCWETLPMHDLRLHRELGGGALLDLGWYCVGASLMSFQDMPTRVSAWAQWANDVDVRMNAFLWFSDDRVATIECGFDTVRRRWIELAGSKKALVCDDFTRPWKPEKPRFWLHDSEGQSEERVCPGPPQEQCMLNAFATLVKQRRYDHPWLKLSRDTQHVCDALARSARTESVVYLS